MAFASVFLVMLMVVAPFASFANAQTSITWTLGQDYSSYSTQSFTPGDTLLFNYDATAHNVEVVSKSDYDNCNTGNALQTFTDGKTTIALKQTGPMYFICGIPGHCAAGMKLQVNVADTASSPTTTPTTPKKTPIAQTRPAKPTAGGPVGAMAPGPSAAGSGLAPKQSSGAVAVAVAASAASLSLVFVALFAFMW